MSTISSVASTSTRADVDIARRWFEALVRGDTGSLAALTHDDIRLRELNPGGLDVLAGAGELRSFTDLFVANAAAVELLSLDARPAGHRIQVTYGFAAGPDRFEIHAFCDVAGGRVRAIDQLCSGRLAA
jgi:hypothetical protein